MADFVVPTRKRSSELRQESENVLSQSLAPKPSPNEVKEPDPNTMGVGEALLAGAVEEYTMGGARHINTGLYGTIDLLRGKEEPYANQYEYWNSYYDEAEQIRGPYGDIVAGIAGALAPGSVARKADQLLDATYNTARKVAPYADDLIRRTMQAAVAGGGLNMVDSWLRNDRDLDQMLISGAFGAGMSGMVQHLVGNNLGPNIMNRIDRLTEDGSLGNLVGRLSIEGPAIDDINPYTLAQQVDAGYGPGQKFLTTQLGDIPIRRNWEQLDNYLANVSFGFVDYSKVNSDPITRGQIKMYLDMQKAVGEAAETVNDQMRAQFSMRVSDPGSRQAALKTNNERLMKARHTYNGMFRDTPDPKNPDAPYYGDQPFGLHGFLDHVEDELAKSFGRSDFKNAPSWVHSIYARFNDELRTVHSESIGRDYRKIPVDEQTWRQINKKYGLDINANNIFDDNLPLVKLMDARQGVADMLSPNMSFQDGLSRSELKAGRELLRIIDEQIDEVTAGKYGLAKGAFAQAMRIDNAYDLGKKFYLQRLTESGDQNKFAAHYGQSLEDVLNSLNKDETAAFQEGFRSAMASAVEERGFGVEMQNLVGQYTGTFKDGGFFSGKEQGISMLRKVLGEDTDEILDIYKDAGLTEAAIERLTATLKEKGATTGQINHIINSINETAKTAPSKTSPFGVSGVLRQLNNALFEPKDAKKANAVLQLLLSEGKDLDDLLYRGLEDWSGGFPQSIGVSLGTGITSGAGSDEEYINPDAKEYQSLLEYLGRVGELPEGVEMPTRSEFEQELRQRGDLPSE